MVQPLVTVEETPAPEADRRKRWIRRARVFLVVSFVLFGAGLWWIVDRAGSASWQASIQRQNLDCSEPLVCRALPGDREVPDATGRKLPAHINRLGFRGPDRTPAHPADTFRVAVFGDSMVYGIGVDDAHTLPAQLETALAARLGRRVEALNFGLPMNFTLSNLHAYRLWARQFSPDAVVFAQPRLTPHDVNHRIRELEASRVLSWLTSFEFGRKLVNVWQGATREEFDEDEAVAGLRRGFEVVREDQARTGMQVVFFDFWRPPGGQSSVEEIRDALPPELAYRTVSSGLTLEQYRASRWPIPGDGHPTEEGQAHFAEILAQALAEPAP